MKLNIKHIYTQLEADWNAHLKDKSVFLPKLKSGSNYTRDALVLVYLYANLSKKVTKTELTAFIKIYYPETNDVQQARHLGAQKGWYILSVQRGDLLAKQENLSAGEYMLKTTNLPYPGFTAGRRATLRDLSDFDEIKKEYQYRCATCGSKEGKPNIHYPSSITKLQKGHMDPNKDLTAGNIIPQCEKCNRPDRNYFVYDSKGRVIKINDPKFVLKSDKKVKEKMLEYLKEDLK